MSRSSPVELKILLDQNVPPRICDFVGALRPSWQVLHASEIGLGGSADEVIFQWAQANGSIIITFDEDFADTRMYPAGSHCGGLRIRRRARLSRLTT